MIDPEICHHILSNLLRNEKYFNAVMPYLKAEYFHKNVDRLIAEEIIKYHRKYFCAPSMDEIAVEIENRGGVSEENYKECPILLEKLKNGMGDVTEKWLIDSTETFCKEAAMYNAIQKSVLIYKGEVKNKTMGDVFEIIRDAATVGFDKKNGLDYFEDAEAVYDHMTKKEDKLSFNLDYFNKITKGGLSKKTLNVILAGVGVGKTSFMTNFAAHTLQQGKNVVYFTLEMSSESISQRVSANMMDVSISELPRLNKSSFVKKVKDLQEKTSGRLIIKEYPTSRGHSGNFRAFLEELELEKRITPDVVVVDYLNICAPMGGSDKDNLYTKGKAVAEELRAIAVEYDVPVLSAAQLNRIGFGNSEPGLDSTADSFGIPATADLMWLLLTNTDIAEADQVIVKQLKNRYHDINYHKSFVVLFDRKKMKFSDANELAQESLSDRGIVEDEGQKLDFAK